MNRLIAARCHLGDKTSRVHKMCCSKVVLVGGGADEQWRSCTARYLNEALEKVWSTWFLSAYDILYCKVLKFRWPNLSFVYREGF